ncbi:uncharacterized protein N7479_008498 [Penicillium vulpinum]|uniref:Uncharacterized protein n=1 Tax=Penicillium vulpinum TaxID=29845 RepID=A0A1V6RM75_9EURO|nr:uncharacterized protein N7479_008498 [Penicillium vulpinum]KAJ5961348.1 hypothetical protein N7479_008498 [Penicillium vulpinum]OQE02927.1 hypothetical protein PENVUL_c037G04652 [Penicillium vulpinum]
MVAKVASDASNDSEARDRPSLCPTLSSSDRLPRPVCVCV